jgi:pyruvate-ferredoxin/flavodoxin oxidoreductase
VRQANFIGCHQPVFLERYDMLQYLVPGGTFLLNTPHAPEEVWAHLPLPVQEQLMARGARFYVIDAYKVARASGMGGRINTVMQVCFFAISGVLPRAEAIEAIKHAIQKTYGKRGDDIVEMNFRAVDQALEHLHEVTVPAQTTGRRTMPLPVAASAPAFVQEVTARMIAGLGDTLPVSALPVDGTYPTGTAQWEKRNLAQDIPVWDPDICIQCGKCAMVCPHSVIRV